MSSQLPRDQQFRSTRHKRLANANNSLHFEEESKVSIDIKQDAANRWRRAASTKHPPLFMIFISIAQIVIFAFYAFRSDEPITMIGPVPFKSKLIYNPYRRYEYWRFLTYMFVHAGYYHIGFNVLIQLLVGIPIEMFHRFYPVFIIYLGGIICGALGNSIADPFSYLAGASSGCYALIAAHSSELIMNWSEMIEHRWCKLFGLITFALVDIGTGVYERHFKYGRYDYRTSYGGHLSGALAGLLLGLIFLRNIKKHPWEETTARIAIVFLVSLTTIAIMVNVLNRDYFPLPDNRDTSWTQNPFAQD